MTTATATFDGQCLCGAVTLNVAAPYDPQVGACHCRMCQTWTGGLFLCFEASAEAVTVDGPVTRYASSPFAERAFCAACGTHLWMRDTNAGADIYDLCPGLFEPALDWPLRSEIYADRAMASVRLKGAHSRTTRAEYEAAHSHIEATDEH